MRLHKVMMGKFTKKMQAKRSQGGLGVKKMKAEEPPETDTATCPDGPLVGMKVRVVDEEILQIFGAESQVTKHRGEHLFLQIEDDFRTWKVREDQVDVLAWVRPAAPKRNLTLTAGDRALL